MNERPKRNARRKKKAKQLVDLEIEEVSGVDYPANDGTGGYMVVKAMREPVSLNLEEYAASLVEQKAPTSPTSVRTRKESSTPPSRTSSKSATEPTTAQTVYSGLMGIAKTRALRDGTTVERAFVDLIETDPTARAAADSIRRDDVLPMPTVEKTAAPPTSPRAVLGEVLTKRAAARFPNETPAAAVVAFLDTKEGQTLARSYHELSE